jgi:hypothetical protein
MRKCVDAYKRKCVDAFDRIGKIGKIQKKGNAFDEVKNIWYYFVIQFRGG